MIYNKRVRTKQKFEQHHIRHLTKMAKYRKKLSIYTKEVKDNTKGAFVSF